MKNKLKIFILFATALFVVSFIFDAAGQESSITSADTIQSTLDTLVKEVESKIDSVSEEITKQKSADENDSGKIKQIITSSKIIGTLLILVVGFYVIRILTKFLNIFSERSTHYRTTFKGLIPIIRILGWAAILLFIISVILKPPIETVIAVTASVGIAVGLAAQDALKNIFGGIMILFDRPFVVGDKIEVGNHYGEVIRIGLRSTRIVTPDDSTVSIPNSEIMSQSVSNANSGEANCQVVAEIYLPVDVDTEKVRQIAVEAAQVSKYVFLNKPIVVLFSNEVKQRKSFLKMKLKAYVMDIRYEFKFKSDMTEIVLRELLKQSVVKKEDLQ